MSGALPWRREAPTALAAVGVAAAGVFGRFGYAYGQGDHDDVLAPVLHRLDPSLLVRDAFVLGQDGMTVRAAFQGAVAALADLIGLPEAVALGYVVSLLGVAAGAYALARTVLDDRLGAALGTVLALVVAPRWTLGGNSLVAGLLVPEMTAWALALPAYALVARGCWLGAGALLGVAAWVHPLVGLLSGGALGLAALWGALAGERARLGGPLRFGLAFATVASVFVVPALVRQAAEAGAVLPDGLSGFDLYARWRFPHHYLPTAFGARRWLQVGALAAAGAAGLALCHRRGLLRQSSFVVRLGVVIVAVCAVVGSAVVGLESLAAARLQVFKLTLPLGLLLCVGVGGAAASAIPAPRRSLRVGLAAAVVVIGLGIARGTSLTDLRSPAVATWARSSTAPDALFAVPPSVTWFRVHAGRSALVTWKAVPFRLDLAAEWARRHRAQAPAAFADGPTPTPEALDEAFASGAGWAEAAQRYGLDYALRPATAGGPVPYPEVYRDARWAVYALRDGR